MDELILKLKKLYNNVEKENQNLIEIKNQYNQIIIIEKVLRRLQFYIKEVDLIDIPIITI